MGLRNLPVDVPAQLDALIENRPGQVSSMALTSLESAASASLFAFAAGESVSEEAYEGDTLYFLVAGEARLSLPTGDVSLRAGQVLMVPRGILHAVYAATDIKLLQLTVS